MIIFGIRGKRSLHQKGVFYCPSCQTEKDYKWHKVRKWFTLYFIPVIPLGIEGEYVECSVCMRTYETNVINYYEEHKALEKEFLAVFQKAIRNIMIKIMLADGAIGDEEKSTIQLFYLRISGDEYPREALNKDIERIQDENTTIKDYVGSVNSMLNEEGKNLDS